MDSRIKIVNAHWSQPTNATPGLYVHLRGPRALAYNGALDEAAREVATWFGFDPDGSASVGLPTQYGVGVLDKHYTFHDVNGKYCATTSDGKRAIQEAKTGPKAVYEYPQYDPRCARTS